MKSRLRHRLSSLKSRIISRDLQDIYLLNNDLTAVRSVNADMTYKIHDSAVVLNLIERVNPLSDQGRHFARRRLDAGDRVVIGYDNEQPVFYGWLMFDEIEMTYGIFLPMPEGVAFAYNLFTKSTHRRQGLMSGFYEFARTYLREQEFHTFYVGIATHNHASIKAHLKNGFEKIGYFYTIKLLGTCFTLARFQYAKRFHIN